MDTFFFANVFFLGVSLNVVQHINCLWLETWIPIKIHFFCNAQVTCLCFPLSKWRGSLHPSVSLNRNEQKRALNTHNTDILSLFKVNMSNYFELLCLMPFGKCECKLTLANTFFSVSNNSWGKYCIWHAILLLCSLASCFLCWSELLWERNKYSWAVKPKYWRWLHSPVIFIWDRHCEWTLSPYMKLTVINC